MRGADDTLPGDGGCRLETVVPSTVQADWAIELSEQHRKLDSSGEAPSNHVGLCVALLVWLL